MIYRAAIMKDDPENYCPKIYLGISHAAIVEAYSDMDDLTTADCVKGFYTDKDEFLTRCEAAKHAYECGQIKRPLPILYSCDIEMKVSA